MNTIKRGSSNRDVQAWQRFLGIFTDTANEPFGMFGQRTHDRTVQFQSKFGLNPDGVVGPSTWQAAGFVGGGVPATWDGMGPMYESSQVKHSYEVAPSPQAPRTPVSSGSGGGSSGSGRTLRQGATGADVAELQSRLNSLGANLTADGNFGPATFSAVKSYQASQGLTADGVVGPATWSSLGTTGSAGSPKQLPASSVLDSPLASLVPKKFPTGLFIGAGAALTGLVAWLATRKAK